MIVPVPLLFYQAYNIYLYMSVNVATIFSPGVPIPIPPRYARHIVLMSYSTCRFNYRPSIAPARLISSGRLCAIVKSTFELQHPSPPHAVASLNHTAVISRR